MSPAIHKLSPARKRRRASALLFTVVVVALPALVAALLLFVSAEVEGRTITVDDDEYSDADFGEIQDAVNAQAP